MNQPKNFRVISRFKIKKISHQRTFDRSIGVFVHLLEFVQVLENVLAVNQRLGPSEVLVDRGESRELLEVVSAIVFVEESELALVVHGVFLTDALGELYLVVLEKLDHLLLVVLVSFVNELVELLIVAVLIPPVLYHNLFIHAF